MLYVFSFFWLSMVIIPVLVPLFESRGLSLAQVFYLQAFFAGVVVLFEVPSGYVADLWGRKNALVVGSVFHGLGFTWLMAADGFTQLMVFELLVGIGMSLMSGADLSLLYDSQEALGLGPDEKTRGIANLRFSKSIAEGVSALIGGVLIIWSFDLVVGVNALFAWIPLVIAVGLTEAPFMRMEHTKPLGNLRKIVEHLLLSDRLLMLVVVNIIFFSLATFYVVWLLQPYWRDQGIGLGWFGVLWAAQSFLFAIACKVCKPMEDRFGATAVLVVMAILPVIGYFGMATLGGAIGIALSFTFFVSRGLNQVILTDALNSRVPSQFRATANSMTSFGFRGVYIVTGPLLGWLTDWQGMYVALVVLGGVSVLIWLLVLTPLLVEIQVMERSRVHSA